MKHVPPFVKRIALALLATVVVVLGVSTVYRAGPYEWHGKQFGSKKHRTDFSIYTEVGKAILNGTSIYEAENPRGWHYNNAPVFGLLFIPFSLIPMFWSSMLWYVLTLAVFAYGVVCAVRLVQAQRQGVDSFWLYLLPVVLLASPIMSALARGQTTPLLFGFAMAGMYWESRQRPWLGGALFSGAILLKIFPVLMLGYYMWQRRWKFVASGVIWCALGVFVIPVCLFGWQGNLNTHKEWSSILRRPTFEQGKSDDPRFAELISPELIRNQSLQSVLKRLTNMKSANIPAAAAGLVMAGAMLWAALLGRGENRLLLIGALIAWMLLMSPVSWNHYFMLLVLPMATLVAAGERDRHVALVALGVFAVINLALAGDRSGYRFGPLCWGSLVVWGGLMILAFRKSEPVKLSASPTM